MVLLSREELFAMIDRKDKASFKLFVENFWPERFDDPILNFSRVRFKLLQDLGRRTPTWVWHRENVVFCWEFLDGVQNEKTRAQWDQQSGGGDVPMPNATVSRAEYDAIVSELNLLKVEFEAYKRQHPVGGVGGVGFVSQTEYDDIVSKLAEMKRDKELLETQ